MIKTWTPKGSDPIEAFLMLAGLHQELVYLRALPAMKITITIRMEYTLKYYSNSEGKLHKEIEMPKINVIFIKLGQDSSSYRYFDFNKHYRNNTNLHIIPNTITSSSETCQNICKPTSNCSWTRMFNFVVS